MIIYLARHGETTGDIENRYGGDYDDHLTDQGQEQSVELAQRLFEKGIQKLYASPLARAQETGSAIGTKVGLSVETLAAFKERNSYGILTGLTKTEAANKYPDQVELLKDFHNTVDGAEEYKSFQQRITAALESVSQIRAEKIAVVTHGGPIRLIFRDILKLGEIEVGDCAYAAIETSEGGYKVLELEGIKVQT